MPSIGDFSRGRDISASEVVMDVNAFSVTNDFYPTQEEQSSSLIGGEVDGTVIETMDNMDESDIEASELGMQAISDREVPRSHVELDKINL